MTLKLPIYLDNHATTPVDPRVFEAMQPYFTEVFGNPASTSHAFGWQAEESVKRAREQVAHLIGAEPKEIVWTSGTTESINLALLGAARTYAPRRNHLVTCVTEHRATLEVCRHLEREGFHATYLAVDSTGLIDPNELSRAITSKTFLVSLLGAQNEIGTIQPLAEIGQVVKGKGVLFHVDAAQACGKIPMNVREMGIDLLSMSAHKVYGPKGVGALYVRKKNPRVVLDPILFGGGQENGLRPGTQPVPNIVGMGKAFEIAGQEMETEATRLAALRDKLYRGLSQSIDNIFLNGHPTRRLPGNLNVSFLPVPASTLLGKLSDIAVSSGSACASGSLEPSYVIRALGVGDDRARSSIRFGLGRFTTEEEIDYTIKRVVDLVGALRKPAEKFSH